MLCRVRQNVRHPSFIIEKRRGKEAQRIPKQPVIYLDILLSVNLFINYFLLLTTAKFLGIPYKKIRLLSGALLGAVFSLIILLPSVPFLCDLLLKIPMSAAMIAASYRFVSWRSFGKQLACLYSVSFSFAGIMLAISYCFQPSGLVIKNSAVYVAVSPILLLAVTVFCYFAITVLYRITGRQHMKNTFCTVTIWHEGKKATFIAKIDTGNGLTEPFSGLPVAIAEEKVLAQILPKKTGELPIYDTLPVRMVPYHTVSGEGLLPAFRPQQCIIRCGKTSIETTSFYLGISTQTLSNTYQGLLNPAILSTGTEKQNVSTHSGGEL